MSGPPSQQVVEVWQRPRQEDESGILANVKEADRPRVEGLRDADRGARAAAVPGERTQRAVFVLRHHEDRKLEEIAEF
jgi:hypothetical protein